MDETLVDRIDAILPQTQCTRCGYPDCRSYATSIAAEGAPINRCPPGGQSGITRLARLLGTAELCLDPAYGSEAPRRTAVIDETVCIGCTLCIQACPVDAIVGSAKRMHTVLVPVCSGCDLCLPPCPVDCIEMVELDVLARNEQVDAQPMLEASPDKLAVFWRKRYRTRNARLAITLERGRLPALTREEASDMNRDANKQRDKSNIVAAALERARIRRSSLDASSRKNKKDG